MAARISDKIMPARAALRECERRLGMVQTIVTRYAPVADRSGQPEFVAMIDSLHLALFGYDRPHPHRDRRGGGTQ